MRILFLSNWYPYPPSNGSKLRIFNLLRGLAREHHVTLLTFTDNQPAPPPPELASLCERVETFSRRPYRPSSPYALAGLLSSTPRSLRSTHDPQVAAGIERELKRERYDLVIASQWAMAAYAASIRQTPALLEEAELGVAVTAAERARTPIHRLRHTLTLWKLRPYVRHVLGRFAACTVVSETEAALLRRFAPEYRAVAVIPNCVDVSSYSSVQATPEMDTLIYSGALSYSANYDAVSWFVQEILPLVRARRPTVRMRVTGDSGGRTLPRTEGLELTGLLSDVRPLIAASWASLAPLRVGGGTRLKILESMALRTPVVTTSKGAEGINAEPGRHLLVADTTAGFAEALIHLLGDPPLRQAIADAGHALVATRYDWSVTLPRFLALAEQVGTQAALRKGA
jgi:glycosyltransferase involved in cell wall biosynthesis